MAKNVRHTRKACVVLALAVASGTVSGDVVVLGNSKATGLALTDRATTATIAAGTSAPGLADGEASVEVQGVATVVALAVATSATNAVGDKVYKKQSDGTYTTTSTSADWIGILLEPLNASGATVKVGLK